ncbi:MAG: DUF3137 domain-containing protein [Micavibrio aeruginosavorus]|uniref:DUF3137 domain-containing protein n=1 Tax=Micavibrio aeruginosavorus TaxID=349221 RepID=A0A7T5UGM3_9BACT|nr:MAG: DUF3137 domain-containing protein [Micavibrio aeruginosavorus]
MEQLRDISDQDFHESVRPRLEQLELVRQAKRAAYLFRRKIAIPLAAALIPVCALVDWMLLRLQSGSDDSVAGITIAMLGALYYWVTQPRREYAKAYKTDILPQIARLFGNLSYQVDGKIPMSDLEPSKIIPFHNRYKSEDCFTGTYKGIRITLSEIHLERRERSGKRTTYTTVFKGLAVLVAMPREKFYGHTVLMENVSGFGKWFQKQSTGLKHADLVDPEFEKAFDVFTNDQVEARYLIDPAMVENLKTMRDAYDARTFSAAYYKNQVLVLLPSKHNYFEPANIEVPATDSQSIISMKEELGHILSLVDRLEVYDAVSLHAARQDGRLPPGEELQPAPGRVANIL